MKVHLYNYTMTKTNKLNSYLPINYSFKMKLSLKHSFILWHLIAFSIIYISFLFWIVVIGDNCQLLIKIIPMVSLIAINHWTVYNFGKDRYNILMHFVLLSCLIGDIFLQVSTDNAGFIIGASWFTIARIIWSIALFIKPNNNEFELKTQSPMLFIISLVSAIAYFITVPAVLSKLFTTDKNVMIYLLVTSFNIFSAIVTWGRWLDYNTLLRDICKIIASISFAISDALLLWICYYRVDQHTYNVVQPISLLLYWLAMLSLTLSSYKNVLTNYISTN